MLTSKASLPGIVLDDTDAELTGVWTHSASTGGYVGNDYIHDADVEKGMKTAAWTLKAATAGNYSLRISYSQNPNRATNVPIRITIGGSTKTLTVNQQKAPAVDSLFQPVDTLQLKAGEVVRVVVSNAGTNGHVIVDAVQLLPVK